jgi:hypothetical protein
MEQFYATQHKVFKNVFKTNIFLFIISLQIISDMDAEEMASSREESEDLTCCSVCFFAI